MSAPPSNRESDQFGFTMVELLVVLVISGILTSAVFQVLGGQMRFSEMQSGREEVQQNARASVELISSELRSIPGRKFLIEEDGTRITFRLPVAWGVLCQEQGGWAQTLWPALPPTVLQSGAALGMVVGAGADSVALNNNEPRTSLGNSCARLLDNQYDSNSIPPGYQVRRVYGGFQELRTPAATSVYLFQTVTYSVGTSAGLEGIWLRRNNEPLAGPLRQGGEGFLVKSDGDALNLQVTMESRHQGSVQQVNSASTTIYFRDNGGAQ